MMNRVRPVLITQQGNARSTMEQAINWPDDYASSQSPARTVNCYVYSAGGTGCRPSRCC